jgi:putative FmdB family regulatory protein
MPTYEYACPECGNRFEKFQSMRDKPIRKCPKCGSLSVKKLIGGGAGLIFKGSGFYATDYKKARAPKEGGEGAKPPAGEAKPGPGASAPPAPAAP